MSNPLLDPGLGHRCECGPGATSRRAFLGGSLGSLLGALLAPRWPLAFARPLEAAAGAAPAGPARSVIVLWLAGGPSHVDSFDPKPKSPSGGPFRAIRTAAPGVELAEHLPRTAAIADRLAFLRSLTSNEGNHLRARYFVQTGYKPQGALRHPAFGSVVAELLGDPAAALPAFVAVRGPSAGAGFLGPAYAPFHIGDPGLPVRNLAPAEGVDAARFERRLELLEAVEAPFAARHDRRPVVGGIRDVRRSAVALMRSPQAKVFDLSSEPQALRDAYGWNDFGQGCLLARRLVEEGVRCVEVTQSGWDTHQDNFTKSRQLLSVFDPAFATLVSDLGSRDLLRSTIVVAMGEFGRTPKINTLDGRDHHPRAFSAVLAGSGLRKGVVVGATDEIGSEIVADPATVPDLIATLCARLDIDAGFEHRTPQGRPIKVVDNGRPIRGLLAT